MITHIYPRNPPIPNSDLTATRFWALYLDNYEQFDIYNNYPGNREINYNTLLVEW
jgi:hypothetical protein